MAGRLINGLQTFGKSVDAKSWLTGSVPSLPLLRVVPGEKGEENVEALPLEPPYENMEEVYQRAEQSQVGTTEETSFRLDARKSKEFPGAMILNQEWAEELEKVCSEVRSKLAPGAGAVNAELYKVLLYQEGDFFKPHQDAQQSERMFASLLFFLPVAHEGGSFQIWDENMPSSVGPWKGGYRALENTHHPEKCSWVAFYTDVRHQVKNVEKGMRLVLNYQLLFEGSMSPSPALPSFEDKLQKAFLSHMERLPRSNSTRGLAVPLQFEYTEATLSPGFLKGIDAVLFNALSEVGKVEMKHSLKVDKTRIFRPSHWEEEAEWTSEFDALYLLDDKTTAEFRRIHQKHKHDDCRATARERAYQSLLSNLDDSYRSNRLVWLVPADSSFASSSPYCARFDSKERYGWLGNMTPAVEYFYLDVVLVLSRE